MGPAPRRTRTVTRLVASAILDRRGSAPVSSVRQVRFSSPKQERMLSDNPFRQPLRRKEVLFKTYVRQANAEGKDAGGNTDFAINITQVRRAGAISRPEAVLWTVLVFWPYLLLATLVGWSIWFAITF